MCYDPSSRYYVQPLSESSLSLSLFLFLYMYCAMRKRLLRQAHRAHIIRAKKTASKKTRCLFRSSDDAKSPGNGTVSSLCGCDGACFERRGVFRARVSACAFLCSLVREEWNKTKETKLCRDTSA
ncbi:hypothetical protein TSAR_000431 [Trichomalopsis sarcophagae]|uniref:Uncharacterized protein n=1 Tax=Trichomalopsis sarcophagae TaxID=543379 RepID=A0A232FHA3_9HYME|nr:hypothetical protein TSAR_000431 [Trichomalopsis sarcophagae]